MPHQGPQMLTSQSDKDGQVMSKAKEWNMVTDAYQEVGQTFVAEVLNLPHASPRLVHPAPSVSLFDLPMNTKNKPGLKLSSVDC